MHWMAVQSIRSGQNIRRQRIDAPEGSVIHVLRAELPKAVLLRQCISALDGSVIHVLRAKHQKTVHLRQCIGALDGAAIHRGVNG